MKKTKARPTLWFGIRTIYLFGRKRDGTNIFEERVVAFSGRTVAQAFAKARQEADKYARDLKLKRHPQQVVYEQDGDPLIDGYEVWSELYESRETIRLFVKNRYDRYQYHPDK
jgi:hypothetical protein